MMSGEGAHLKNRQQSGVGSSPPKKWLQKNQEKFKKTLDKPLNLWYNKATVRERTKQIES